jgi:tRNA dimethylallyltransferase
MTNKYLIIITGPTAIGKTDLALQLNAFLKTSIISADSRQVYKEMSIGTAKPSKAEILAGNIKLVDHVSVHDHYNAGTFAREAKEIIEDDFKRHDCTIICGGTGLYISAVIDGLHDFPEINSDIKSSLETDYKANGLQPLLKELESKDPDYYQIADINNPRRVIRALEIIRQSGKPYTYFTSKDKEESNYQTIEIILEEDRQILYDRINKRVETMMEKGLLEEVESLVAFRHLKALQTVGYAELFDYLDGNSSLEHAVSEIQKHSRRFAKRQITWLSRYQEKRRFSASDSASIIAFLKEKGLDNF